MPETIHVDLSEVQPGATAELRPTPWGLLKEAVGVGEGEWVAFTEKAVARVVTSWTVKAADGSALPLPGAMTPEQLDNLDARVMLTLSRQVGALLKEAQGDPNAGGASSASSSETPTPAAS